MNGRRDTPTYGVLGTKIVPVTATGRPWESVEEYMIRVEVTTDRDSPSGSSRRGAGSERMIVPEVLGMVAGGS